MNVVKNTSSILILIGITLFTGIMAGGYPALMLSSFKPVMTLKGKLQSKSGSLRLRRVLVVGQFTATIVLIIASIIMMRQLHYMKSRDLGLVKDHVVVIPLNNELRQSYPMFKSEISQNPQIIHVTSGWNNPTDINHFNMVSWEGRSREETVWMRDQLRIFVKIRPDELPGTLRYLMDTVNRFAPNHPYQYSFLDEVFNQQYRSDERVGTIYGYFTAMAIIISCMGLFGMASFIVERRTKEIGIRKVVGASTIKIMLLISGQFMMLLALSNLIAWPIAYFMMRFMLSRYAYRTDLSVWVFFATAGSTFIIALLSICVKVIKASAANPVEALKYE